MAFTGVNRANVAVTDTFDTWRIRTNEVNTTLNLGTSANTADTLVYRDNDGSANLNILNANTTILTHTGTSDTALSVVSAVAADSGGSYASIKTTGGIYASLTSKFAADLTIGTDLTVTGNTALGATSADEVTFNSTLSGDILPTVTSGAATITDGAATGSDLGASANSFAHIYTVQETISATSGVTTNVFSVTSAAGAGNTATFVNDSATTGTVLSATSTSTDTGPRKLVQITNDAAAATGTTALSIQSDAGRGIFVDSTLAAGGYSFEIDGAQQASNTAKLDVATTTGTGLDVLASGVLATTGTAVGIRSDTVTTGTLLSVNSAATNTGTRSLVKITNDAPAATGVTAFEIDSDAGRGIYINSGLAASLPSFQIDSSLATTNTAIIAADATTDGTALEISADLLEDGRALDISSTSTDASARRLVSITNDAAAATGTDALYIQSDAGKGIYVTSTLAAGGPALDILSAHQTTDAINVVANSLTDGGILNISSSSTNGNARDLALITQSGQAGAAGVAGVTALNIATTSGRGIFINSDDADGEEAFQIDAEQTTTNTVSIDAATTTGTSLDIVASGVLVGAGKAVDIRSDTVTTGTLLQVYSNGNSTGTRTLEKIHTSNVAATGTTGLTVLAEAGRGLFIDTNLAAGGYSLEIDAQQTTSNTAKIDSAATSGTMLELTASGILTGKGVEIISDTVTTGTLLSVNSAATNTSTRKLVQITNDAAAATGTTALSIQSDAGRGIFIDSNLAAGLPSLQIDSEHDTVNAVSIDAATTTGTSLDIVASGVLATTGKAVEIRSDTVTTGTLLYVNSAATNTSTRDLVKITNDAAAAVATTALSIQSDGGRGIFIDSNLAAGLPALEIDSEHTSANTVIIKSDILSTGSALQVSSTGTHSSNLVSFISDGAATGPTLHLRSDASSGSVKVLQVANSTADIFSVTQAGDATIGNDLTIAGDFVVTGNLTVSGTTSEINTTTTLIKDKTLVLGAASDVVSGVSYTAADPAVLTSTAHGLSDGDVLFVTSSTGTAVVSEQLIKVANKTTNTFELNTIADVAIDGTSDSTTRTLSWVGPQLDSSVDDVGLYAPGNTAIHTIKWDDTDKYWESNASLFINDTGQLVLPKGNDTLSSASGHKPTSSATATVPAATTGAMRFNTDNSKIEAVTTGTTYENMSTESFAIAVAVALA